MQDLIRSAVLVQAEETEVQEERLSAEEVLEEGSRTAVLLQWFLSLVEVLSSLLEEEVLEEA